MGLLRRRTLGLRGSHHGFWGMSDHRDPNDLVQTNLTIPPIGRHLAAIPARRVAARLTSQYGLFPTLLVT